MATAKKTHNGTRERILASAQTLFAEKGFAGTSLRMITSAAEVNLGAVNYHFVSKDALIAATLKQSMEPLNSSRLALLDEFEEAANGDPVPVSKILEAHFRPALEMETKGSKNDPALRLMGMMFSEPGDYMGPLLQEELADVTARFLNALEKSLPSLDESDLFWCVHFSIGTFIHTVSHFHALSFLSAGLCTLDDSEDALRRLIEFCEGGLREVAQNRETS